jgi:hypothetical protein
MTATAIEITTRGRGGDAQMGMSRRVPAVARSRVLEGVEDWPGCALLAKGVIGIEGSMFTKGVI